MTLYCIVSIIAMYVLILAHVISDHMGNKMKASTDVAHDIRKIICEDLCRNVYFVSYDNSC